MAKTVRAKEAGYVGKRRREQGEEFVWPEDVPMGKWVEPVRFGGKGDHDGDGKDGGAAPANTGLPADFVLPADWRNLSAKDRKALADKINGSGKVANANDADVVIEAYEAAHKPEAFSDAPAPQTVQQALASTGNGPTPDWVAPDATPVQADDE